jgi:hypothetical protein
MSNARCFLVFATIVLPLGRNNVTNRHEDGCRRVQAFTSPILRNFRPLLLRPLPLLDSATVTMAGCLRFAPGLRTAATMLRRSLHVARGILVTDGPKRGSLYSRSTILATASATSES